MEVLLIEDDELLREVVAKIMLKDANLFIRCATGKPTFLQTSLDLAAEHNFEKAIIGIKLINAQAKIENGIEVGLALKLEHPDISICFMSGDPHSMQDADLYPELKCAPKLAMPFPIEDLKKFIYNQA